MRIGIDARFYGLSSAGLARYTQELLNELGKLSSAHTFVVFIHPEDAAAFPGNDRFELVETTTKHYSLKEQFSFKREVERAHLDLMHFTNFNHPIRYRGPFVITIHDLTLLRHAGKSLAAAAKVPVMRGVLRSAFRNALEVVTISEYQKRLIIEGFHPDPAKIRVVYNGIDERFHSAHMTQLQQDAFRKKKTGGSRYIMYAGQWRQHKNLVRLLKAYELLRRHHDVKLALVGKVDPAFPIIPKTISELKLEEDVILTDFVEDDELLRYYGAAEVFAFPSLAEGFGFTPLEAIAAGVPVASSSAEPMPEILGDAAVYFNPRSTEDMVSSIESLLVDKGLRKQLIEKGAERVRQFSWQTTATQMLAVYDRALTEKA